MHKLCCSILIVGFTSFLFAGCGDSTQTEPVAAGDEIEQYLAENPEMAIDAEEEASLMQGDAAVEDQ
jgi:hypothetical protein